MDKIMKNIIKQQTIVVLENIKEVFNVVQEKQMNRIIIGWPIWKQLYHMLHSLDQWFINPYDYHDPLFHESGMNSLDTVSKKSLTKTELLEYFNNIKLKTKLYLDSLTAGRLIKKPKECKFTRLALIFGQFRHIMYHIGFIHSCLLTDTGKIPDYKGLGGSIRAKGKKD